MIGINPGRLELTEEEAFALLSLAMTSPQKLDVTSEKAIKKLAIFCTSQRSGDCNHSTPLMRELDEAG